MLLECDSRSIIDFSRTARRWCRLKIKLQRSPSSLWYKRARVLSRTHWQFDTQQYYRIPLNNRRGFLLSSNLITKEEFRAIPNFDSIALCGNVAQLMSANELERQNYIVILSASRSSTCWIGIKLVKWKTTAGSSIKKLVPVNTEKKKRKK